MDRKNSSLTELASVTLTIINSSVPFDFIEGLYSEKFNIGF